ncbi:threonine-phosphate decarboxylase [uncultured Tateyamaria sp.]|uniref:threonine-phosphate decarboxylase n=1 Tax=uncultured Tateyamaria sp. TaxID=455651 RepID=UPI00260850CD|nr:threonine-phosphate decarboxylase [uncultured Tateyamaria sp.]
MAQKRDHGGGLDAAVARYGGRRDMWVDLSTGINPEPYPVEMPAADAWTALPDESRAARLVTAARRFWSVPDGAAVLAAPGASALISQIPRLAAPATVCIPAPTYNEHAAAFAQHGWTVAPGGQAQARVEVHPNNPDGNVWNGSDVRADLHIIDESFCDVMPEASLIGRATRPGTVILKSFGKFWGLAGLRLGFAIGDPAMVARLADMLGPWPVSGPALDIGARALEDVDWAEATRGRLAEDAKRLDGMFDAKGAALIGGTDLFRLYRVDDAQAWQDRLARGHVWSRTFPYASDWLRIGLPPATRWDQVEAAL